MQEEWLVNEIKTTATTFEDMKHFDEIKREFW